MIFLNVFLNLDSLTKNGLKLKIKSDVGGNRTQRASSQGSRLYLLRH